MFSSGLGCVLLVHFCENKRKKGKKSKHPTSRRGACRFQKRRALLAAHNAMKTLAKPCSRWRASLLRRVQNAHPENSFNHSIHDARSLTNKGIEKKEGGKTKKTKKVKKKKQKHTPHQKKKKKGQLVKKMKTPTIQNSQ